LVSISEVEASHLCLVQAANLDSEKSRWEDTEDPHWESHLVCRVMNSQLPQVEATDKIDSGTKELIQAHCQQLQIRPEYEPDWYFLPHN
jgi:hypothetical protein